MREIEELAPGDYNVCFSCPARTVDPVTFEVGCNKNVFSTLNRSGGVRAEPRNCPFPSTPIPHANRGRSGPSVDQMLRDIIGK